MRALRWAVVLALNTLLSAPALAQFVITPRGSGSSSGTNTGDVSLAAVGAVPNANGASLAGQVLNLQPASSTQPGVVTTGTQTLGNNTKTFTDINITTPTFGVAFSGSAKLFNDGAGTLNIRGGVANSAGNIGFLFNNSTALSSNAYIGQFASGGVSKIRMTGIGELDFPGVTSGPAIYLGDNVKVKWADSANSTLGCTGSVCSFGNPMTAPGLGPSAAIALPTCAAGLEGRTVWKTGTGASSGAATQLCRCRSDGAGAYAWKDIETMTVGTSTTCPP